MKANKNVCKKTGYCAMYSDVGACTFFFQIYKYSIQNQLQRVGWCEIKQANNTTTTKQKTELLYINVNAFEINKKS